MPESRIRPSWRAPALSWIQPAPRHAPYAVIPTVYGDCTLFRGPGRRLSPAAKAEQWERWQLVFGGDTVLEIQDAAAPWYALRTRMRLGVHGTLEGVPFTARAEGRSFLARRRGIHFALGDGQTLSFTARRLHRCLVRGAGGEERVVARSRGADCWESERLERGEVAVLCFVVVSGADALLTSPLLNL
ncbi:hypothetical protein AB0D45_00985 [Streptomyces sp. NPDC048352]|uniref:hypothetical protein n=1 Tax=Streptomyces sp. NPDC048352 TaxID=3154718 RepID=UPI00344125A8